MGQEPYSPVPAPPKRDLRKVAELAGCALQPKPPGTHLPLEGWGLMWEGRREAALHRSGGGE